MIKLNINKAWSLDMFMVFGQIQVKSFMASGVLENTRSRILSPHIEWVLVCSKKKSKVSSRNSTEWAETGLEATRVEFQL
jgi:hypothetical protein